MTEEEYNQLCAHAHARGGSPAELALQHRFPPEKLGVEYALVEIISKERVGKRDWYAELVVSDITGRNFTYRSFSEDKRLFWMDVSSGVRASQYRSDQIAHLLNKAHAERKASEELKQ